MRNYWKPRTQLAQNDSSAEYPLKKYVLTGAIALAVGVVAATAQPPQPLPPHELYQTTTHQETHLATQQHEQPRLLYEQTPHSPSH